MSTPSMLQMVPLSNYTIGIEFWKCTASKVLSSGFKFEAKRVLFRIKAHLVMPHDKSSMKSKISFSFLPTVSTKFACEFSYQISHSFQPQTQVGTDGDTGSWSDCYEQASLVQITGLMCSRLQLSPSNSHCPGLHTTLDLAMLESVEILVTSPMSTLD